MRTRLRLAGAVALLVAGGFAHAAAKDAAPHNLILFVADGLRARQVDAESAPAMAALAGGGVRFTNSHSIFPTLTTPNASALATGHQVGDTGNFGNALWTGRLSAIGSHESLADLDARFGGDYLNETTLLAAARRLGFSTAAIGKLGATSIFDHTERSGQATILFDDATGRPEGRPLSAEVQARLAAAGLPGEAPDKGLGAAAQQAYSVDVTTQVVLPLFKARGRPFLLVFWSREPDHTQHDQQDSLGAVSPGINGPSSRAALHLADENLARLRRALDDLGLAQSTNLIVTADHGFATISKESATSQAARGSYSGVAAGQLPPGFVALDLARALDLPLFDPEKLAGPLDPGKRPPRASLLLGRDATSPEVVVAANGGCDLLYLPRGDRHLAGRIVEALLAEDYTDALFVDPALGRFAGALALSDVNLVGSALTPHPSIIVSFRRWTTGCAEPELCTVGVADTRLLPGQGMHGGLSLAETRNFMAASGPDFKSRFVATTPVSNADVGRTIAHLMGLDFVDRGPLVGRVMTEALPGGKIPRVVSGTLRSEPSASGLRTVLTYQRVKRIRYLDAATLTGHPAGP